jgi:hypothetical protein
MIHIRRGRGKRGGKKNKLKFGTDHMGVETGDERIQVIMEQTEKETPRQRM